MNELPRKLNLLDTALLLVGAVSGAHAPRSTFHDPANMNELPRKLSLLDTALLLVGAVRGAHAPRSTFHDPGQHE